MCQTSVGPKRIPLKKQKQKKPRSSHLQSKTKMGKPYKYLKRKKCFKNYLEIFVYKSHLYPVRCLNKTF